MGGSISQCPVLEFDTILIARWLVRGLGSDGRTKFDGPFSGWVGNVGRAGNWLIAFFRAARNSLWEFMTLIFGEW